MSAATIDNFILSVPTATPTNSVSYFKNVC